MQIPENYRDVYSKAQKIDAELERRASEEKGGSILIPRHVVVRNIENIIRLENEIAEAKKRLREYGIEI